MKRPTRWGGERSASTRGELGSWGAGRPWLWWGGFTVPLKRVWLDNVIPLHIGSWWVIDRL